MELHRPNATRRLRWLHRTRLVACALLVIGAYAAIAGPAAAGGDERRGIVVVQIKGLLDVPNVSLLKDTIKQVNADRRTLLLIQLDARGAIADVDPVMRAINRSRVPVVIWVGPPGAEATGGAAVLTAAAHRLFRAPGSTIGSPNPIRLDQSDDGDSGLTVTGQVPHGQRPTIGETIVKLDGKTIETADGEHTLSTAKVIGEGRDRRRQPNQEVVFETLDLAGQVQHSLISPTVAYFFLVIGLALIVFEFFAASIGFAAFVGALCVVGALYGFSHLPVHWWAVALLLLSTFGFAIDAQAGGLGFWTAVGSVALIAGSVTLYGGTIDLRPSWWAFVVVIASVGMFHVLAIPSFIRARFSTPTVGREGVVGEIGTAEVAVDPDGVVVIRDARWRARTNRATPIAAGGVVRVVSVEGLVLEVEPESGGAHDHRDRARRKK
ncbi:MAG: NfeD family protein [Acidimicrobiia bacterium]